MKPIDVNIQLPAKLRQIFVPEGVRYRGAKGGRGSAKSAGFAQMALARGMERKRRILCAREIQMSIRESVHAEISNWVENLGLSWFYDVGDTYIRGLNGTEFIYRGLLRNLNSIKSMSSIDIVWLEEAETISENSWVKLDPTIRAPGAEIWACWNPEEEDSPTNRRFREGDPMVAVAEVNWRDNPWFPPSLNELRLRDKERDPDAYDHIWEGKPISRSDAQILHGKWAVEDFDPASDWEGPYWGLDWGFSQDPLACVKMWVHDETLYIEYELFRTSLELRDTAPELLKIPGMTQQSLIVADNARPESISHVKGDGMNIKACEKWPGSVEDGIAHLRGVYKRIVIHPRCRNLITEARMYKYKVDPYTDEVTSTIVDKHNHGWDAVRYGLGRRIQRRGKGFFGRPRS